MKFIRVAGLVVLLLVASIRSETLPGSCAVIATQTYIKVSGSYWRALIAMEYVDPEDFPTVMGHMICVWQPFEGSHIFAYNVCQAATIELNTSSTDLNEITKGLSASCGFIILKAHFVQ